MLTMYDGLVNSPETTTTNNISNSDTIIYVLDPSRVPAELPNLMTLGTGTNAETVKVTAVDDNALTVERGFQGTAAAWNAGTIIARTFTEYDYNALKENILELESDKEELIKDAEAKTTPVDADTMPISDSAASGATKKITWANIKAGLKTYFDTLYVALTNVANNLTTTAAGYVLDARQGKELGDLISTKVNPNVIINGCFRVNQRVKSGTVTLSAGVYGHDRWKAGVSGCTYTFATSGGITTITITSGSLIQVVEGNNLETATYCLSWTGTAQGKIGAGSAAASPVTGAVTGGSNLNIEFGTGTLSKVKFERGSVPTPFELRPFNDEVTLCRRYYEKSYALGTAPGAADSTNGITFSQGYTRVAGSMYYGEFTYPYKVTKRATPTVTIYAINGTINAFYNGGSGVTITGTVMTPLTQPDIVGISGLSNISADVLSGFTIMYHFISDAEL